MNKLVTRLMGVTLCLLLSINITSHAHGFIPIPLETLLQLEAQQQSKYKVMVDAASLKNFPLSEDLNALSKSTGEPSVDILQRLFSRGESVIPGLLLILKQADAPFTVKAIAMVLVLDVATEEQAASVFKASKLLQTEVLKQGHASSEFPYRHTYGWLNKAPTNHTIQAFIKQQLSDATVQPVIKAMALNYLASQSAELAKPWANLYQSPTLHPTMKNAALYLAAMQGDASVKTQILQQLNSMETSSYTYKTEGTNLLKGLLNIAGEDEFEQLVEQHKLNIHADEFKLYRMIKNNSLVTNTDYIDQAISQRNAIAEQIIETLIQQHNAQPLLIHWQVNNPWVRQQLQQKGLAMQVTENQAHFIPFNNNQRSNAINNTPEALASALLHSLKTNDEAAFKQLVISDSHLIKLLEIKSTESTQASWQTLKQRSAAAGVNWQNVQLNNVSTYILVAKYRLQMASIEVHASSANTAFSIVLKGVLYYDDKWQLTMPVSWRGENHAGS